MAALRREVVEDRTRRWMRFDEEDLWGPTLVDLQPAWLHVTAEDDEPVQDPTVPFVREPAPPAPPMTGLDVSALPPPRAWFRRMWKGERLMHYHRLIALAVVVNALLAWRGAGSAADLALGNFAVALLIRQHYVINLLFWVATRAPLQWPLALRATLAKVYHFGGVHVGAALAGTVWYLVALGARVRQGPPAPLAVIVAAQALVLLAICWVSRRSFRGRRHDTFEIVKRLGGWTSLGLFWAETALTHRPLLEAPQTWVLALVSISVALPWLRLRRVAVDLTVPSRHVAIARFDYGVTPFAGSSTALSRSPLLEWHSFANIPSPGRPGFRLAISRAGDWTGKLIDDRPSHIWVKGIPTAGVANIEVLFRKVVYVATGSGLGPCLPHLLARKVPARLLWATRDPRKTYGQELLDEIVGHHPDAVIWDTDVHGKPDLVELAYRLVRESGAEAVICISNKAVTWKVVYGLESRGIPAYGAIWDS